MKKILTSFVIFISIITIVIAAGTWTPGTFEIHMLDVGQGMSQLVISPIGKTLLMDCPEWNWNSSKCAEAVSKDIERITGGKHVDYIVASHLHLDHMGYAGKGGIWALINKYGITCNHLVDRDAGYWQDFNMNGIYDKGEIVWKNAGTTSGTGEKWLAWVTNPNSPIYSKREIAKLGSSDQIQLGGGVIVTVVQTDAQGVVMKDGKTPLIGDHTNDAMPPSENDYSITLWVKFGDFDYVFGGDTDGQYEESSIGYTYNDIESVVAPRIGQKVEALSVNHHGSSHSSNQTYVNTLKPQVTLYNVGENSYGHPTTSVVQRYRDAGTTQYFTEKGNLELSGSDIIIANGDITIKSTDGKSYTVNGKSYTCYPITNSKIVLIGTDTSQTDDVGIATITYSGGVTIIVNKKSDSAGTITVKGNGNVSISDLGFATEVVNQGSGNITISDLPHNKTISNNSSKLSPIDVVSPSGSIEIVGGNIPINSNSEVRVEDDAGSKLTTTQITAKTIELNQKQASLDMVKGASKVTSDLRRQEGRKLSGN